MNALIPCEFCGGLAEFERVESAPGAAWWLVGLNGSGSDYLATWCNTCGPKRRAEVQA